MGQRMRHFLGAALCLLLASTAWSEEIRGTVTDASGAVIQDAAVELLLSNLLIGQTSTNLRGQFLFDLDKIALPEKSATTALTLVCSSPGFANTSHTIRLVQPSELQVTVVLQIAAGQESMEVSDKIPAYKDRLDMSEVRDSPAKDLGEALSAVDGVFKLRKGGIANDLVVRGFQQNNINVLVDGSRTYGACPGHMDPAVQHVDFAEVERVDIAKGAFDVANQGSLGAVVNVVTKSPGAGFRLVPSLSAGSFGYYNPSATLSYGTESFKILGGYSYRTGDPYKDGSGHSFTSYSNYSGVGRQQRSFNINTGWTQVEFSPVENHFLSLSYTRQQAGLILYPYLTMDANSDNADRAIVKYRLTQLSPLVRNLRLETYFTQVKHFMSNDQRSNAPNGVWTMASSASSQAVGGRAEVDLGRDFTFGLESYYRNWNVLGYMKMGMTMSASNSLPDVDTRTLGSFVSYRHSVTDRLQVSGGFRFDHASMQPAAGVNTDKYYQFQNTRRTGNMDNYPSGNIRVTIAALPSVEVFAGAGTTGRLPDAEERYISRVMGTKATVGDPTLPITRNTEAELGVNFKRGRSYLRPTAFYSYVSDYIIVNNQPQRNSMAMPGSMGMSAMSLPMARSYTNVDARIYGGELTYALGLTESLSLSGGTSYSRGLANRKQSANVLSRNLPEMPPLRSWAALRYVYQWMFAEIGGTAANRQTLVDTDLKESETAGYGVMNLKLGFSHRKLSGSFAIDNLLNRFYYEHLSYYRDPFAAGMKVPEPGRNFFAQLRYRF